MKRRQFVTLFVSAAIAWPLAAHGQQLSTPVRRIAVLLRVAKDDPDTQRDLQAFRDGLEALGWSAGKILIEYRYASADPAHMDAYAAELIGLPAEVILAQGSLAVAALRKATQTIPIVFVRVADPLSQGFVASLARPGGNVTGFASLEYALSGKWLASLRAGLSGFIRDGGQFVRRSNPAALSSTTVAKSRAR